MKRSANKDSEGQQKETERVKKEVEKKYKAEVSL